MLVEEMGTKFKFMAFFNHHLFDSPNDVPKKAIDGNGNQPLPAKPVGFLMYK